MIDFFFQSIYADQDALNNLKYWVKHWRIVEE